MRILTRLMRFFHNCLCHFAKNLTLKPELRQPFLKSTKDLILEKY